MDYVKQLLIIFSTVLDAYHRGRPTFIVPIYMPIVWIKYQRLWHKGIEIPTTILRENLRVGHKHPIQVEIRVDLTM